MNVGEDVVFGLSVFMFLVMDFDSGLNGLIFYLMVLSDLSEFWCFNLFIGEFIVNGKRV